MKTYFIIISNGVPVDVTNIYSQAVVKLQEWDSRGRPAELIECIPLQTEFAFMEPSDFDDESTEETAQSWEMRLDARP